MMRKWVFRITLISMLAFVAISILIHTLATNDGPVHVAFAHIILSYQQPDHPLQTQAYSLNLRPNPNLSVYLLMAALMRILSPAMTESIIQILCILGPVASGYFALHMINRKNVWLSIFLFPFTLNQMLFLGLYNHSISIAAFLLVIGTYFWMMKAPSYPRAVALGGCLILAFLCHASGFIMAFSSLAAMAATLALLSISRRGRLFPSLWAQRFTMVALVIPLPLGVLFLTSGDKHITKYGLTLPYRLRQFAELHLLSANYPLTDRFPIALLGGLVFFSFFYVVVRILTKRQDLSQSRRDLAIAAMIATLISTVIVFIFPDIMGGGWTHFRRFEIFPFFWMVLVVAFDDLASANSVVFTTTGAVIGVWLIASLFVRQHMIREQMKPFAAADSLIAAHCTVLPIIFQSFLLDRYGNPDFMDYEPFFQAASRFELHDDRVVLFNYLARLPAYPVHFRPGIEPQANIFHWEPEHIPNNVEEIDIPDFEAGSGMRVDYILLRGDLGKRPPGMRLQVQSATRQFVSIYKSGDNGVELYRRQGDHNPSCVIDK